MTRHARAVLFLAATALAPVALLSAAAQPQDRAGVLDAQARVAAEAEAARETAADARRAAGALRLEREQLAERIRTLGERIVAREDWIAGADDRIAALRADISDAEARLSTARERMIILATALQRIGREPTPAMLLNPDRPRVAARNLAQIRALMRQLDAAKIAAQTELDRIDAASAAAREEEAAARAERVALEVEIAEADALLQERRRAETELEARAAAAEARANALAEQAGSLGELAASLTAPPAEATAASAPPPPRAVAHFSEARGLLLRPAAGVLRGVRSVDGAHGAVVVTRPSAQVIAPWSGVVRYADMYRSHRAVIIEPESGYAIVLTGLGAITAREGERVEAGQLIGRMPGTVALGGEAREELYIEIYDGRRPRDPVPWFQE